MAPINPSIPFNSHGLPFPSATGGGYGFGRNSGGSYGNESVSERGWDMSEDNDHMDDDMNDTALVHHQGRLSLPELNHHHLGPCPHHLTDSTVRITDHSSEDELPMARSTLAQLDPEVESFAEHLDAMCYRASGADRSECDLVAFETIRTFRNIAMQKAGEYHALMDELQTADDVREINGEVHARDASGQHVSLPETQRTIGYWESESHTWDLFLQLSKHRLSKSSMPVERIPAEFDQHTSNLKYKNYLLDTDPQFRELNIILEWVKRHAPPPRELEDTRGAGWAYTRGILKQRKRSRHGGVSSFRAKTSTLPNLSPTHNSDGEAELVTELDPDAPSRQQKYLEEEDTAFEQRLMRVVFDHLRAGDVEGAMEKCQQLKEHWRAQSLAGGMEAWDKDIDGSEDGLHGVQGNRRRELWRRMCYRLAKESGNWESAVYGILSGDLDTVLPRCETWEDHLFAHINSLIETKYHNFLALHHRIPATVEKFPIYDAILNHGGPDGAFLPRIIDYLQENSQIEFGEQDSQRILQGSLISERLDIITAELSRQLALYGKDPDYEPEDNEFLALKISDFKSFRVIVHILLVLKLLGSGAIPGTQAWTNTENVIAGYIQLLATAGKHDLIPLYAGQLSKAKAIQVMGVILVQITDERSRERHLKLMEKYEIDIPATLKEMMATALIRSQERYKYIPIPKSTGVISSQINSINNPEALEEEDEALIRALEWLLLVKSLRNEVMRAGCKVYMRFFLTGRLAAARELLKRIPSTIVIPKDSTTAENMDTDDSPVEVQSDDHDALQGVLYMEFEGFLRAILALKEWKAVIRNAPDSKRDRVYKVELERAYESIQAHTRPVAENWIIEFTLSATWQQSPEGVKIQEIRNTYIPDLIIELHHVYAEAGKYLRRNLLPQTLELAALVGSHSRKGREIVRCLLEKRRLREYVDLVAEASRRILGAAQAPGREMSRRGTVGGGGGSLQIWNVK
ncbi:107-domain-containing protein [Peziza echinospora]|nr:107-domain-containing protein [Peziza echinospora]